VSVIVSDFMSAIPTLSPAQLLLVQNQLCIECYKRLMSQT
jgi:hypothetical protein